MLHIGLFIGMVLIGVFYALILHSITPLIMNSLLIHCLILGLGFGGLNFIMSTWVWSQHSKLKKRNKTLNAKLLVDSLTGLLNRRAFDLEIEKITSSLYSIIFMDIDNFRIYNNDYGHETGDRVLQKVSQVVQAQIRMGDKAFRYGGEEIVILLEHCEKEKARQIAENIRDQIQNIGVNENFPPITLSLGIASCPVDGQEFHKVLNHADQALLTAKKTGKNCTICYPIHEKFMAHS